MILKEIGERVREARMARGMTQAQLARDMHVSAPFISNIEQGKQTMSIITIREICRVLNVSADWVLCNVTPETNRIADAAISQNLKTCSLEEKNAMLRVISGLADVLRLETGKRENENKAVFSDFAQSCAGGDDRSYRRIC